MREEVVSLSLLHGEKQERKGLQLLFTATRQEKIGVLCIRRDNNEERKERIEVITEMRIAFSGCQPLVNNFLAAEKKGGNRTEKFSRFQFLCAVSPSEVISLKIKCSRTMSIWE